jgi:hypothetical protein
MTVGSIALEKLAACLRGDPKDGGTFLQYTVPPWYLHLVEGIYGQMRELAYTRGL